MLCVVSVKLCQFVVVLMYISFFLW